MKIQTREHCYDKGMSGHIAMMGGVEASSLNITILCRNYTSNWTKQDTFYYGKNVNSSSKYMYAT